MGRSLSPYETDFVAWSQEQAAALRQAAELRLNMPVDWLNVAEELDSMGRSDKHAIESHLVGIVEHLLKLRASPAAEPRRLWENSVDHHRHRARRLLSQSPSLRPHLTAVFAECWEDGRDLAVRGLLRDGLADADLPAGCPYTLEQCLDVEWWG